MLVKVNYCISSNRYATKKLGKEDLAKQIVTTFKEENIAPQIHVE